MTDERHQNERALTKEEKNDFLIELADLCLRYGVDIREDGRFVVIHDSHGNTLFECISFEQSDCKEILDR